MRQAIWTGCRSPGYSGCYRYLKNGLYERPFPDIHKRIIILLSKHGRKDTEIMSDFKVTHYNFHINERLYSPGESFTAVFLSDLHNHSYGEKNSRLLQAICKEKPELILIAGDMLTAGKQPEMDAALSLLDELTKRFPVFYGNGNHEYRMKANTQKYGDQYDRYSSMLRQYGCHLLENSYEQFRIHGLPLCIWGLELPPLYFAKGHREVLRPEQIRELIGEPDPGACNILLAHHPMYFDAYAAWGADLTLSGHLHGGIVRLPFVGGIVSPQIRLFPKYDRGMYRREESTLIVSAGLGSHTIPVRINNPAELVVIRFRHCT